jgi:hypothetical protein
MTSRRRSSPACGPRREAGFLVQRRRADHRRRAVQHARGRVQVVVQPRSCNALQRRLCNPNWEWGMDPISCAARAVPRRPELRPVRLASVVLLGVYSRQHGLGLCDDPRTRSEITGIGPRLRAICATARHSGRPAAAATMVGPPTGGVCASWKVGGCPAGALANAHSPSDCPAGIRRALRSGSRLVTRRSCRCAVAAGDWWGERPADEITRADGKLWRPVTRVGRSRREGI